MKLPWFIIKRLINRSVSKYGMWWGKLQGHAIIVVGNDCDPEDPYGECDIMLFVDGYRQYLNNEYLDKFYIIDEVLDRIHEIVR